MSVRPSPVDSHPEDHPELLNNHPQLSFADIQYDLCKQFFNQTQSREAGVEEIRLLVEQNKVLKMIQADVNKRNKAHASTDFDDSASLSITSLTQRPSLALPFRRTSDYSSFWEYKQDRQSTSTTLDDDMKLRRTSSINKVIPQTEIEKALAEIEEKCDSSTTQLIRHLINRSTQLSKRLRDNDEASEALEKTKKQLSQLKQVQADLQKKIVEYEGRIRGFEAQNSQLRESNQSRKSVVGINIDRQKQLSKIQTALLLKQKLLSEDMKRLANKMNMLKKQEDFLMQQRKKCEQIWDKIVERVEVGEQFRMGVYSKCKESLMSQRKHLQEEAVQLDMHHQYIQKMISQMQTVL